MDHVEMVELVRDKMRQQPFLKLASLFAPQKVEGFEKIRLGSDFDGGYVMLDDFAGIDLALSFGVETNADWDLAIAERGVPVQQYDHTVPGPPIAHPKINFFPQKIVAQGGDETSVSISTLLADAKISRDASAILKIDIESDEWPVFLHCPLPDLLRFSQILVEFHNFSYARDPNWLRSATQIMTKLRDHFGIYHVHANNWSPMATVGNVYFPETLEVSFANRSRYKLMETDEVFPTPLDQPNNPLRPDLYLGAFRYRPF